MFFQAQFEKLLVYGLIDVCLQVQTFIDFKHTEINMDDILICKDTWEGTWKVAYTIVTSCAQFLVPVFFVIPLYIAIYLKLKNRPQVNNVNGF